MALERSESPDSIDKELDYLIEQDRMALQNADGPISTSVDLRETGEISSPQEKLSNGNINRSAEVNNNGEEEEAQKSTSVEYDDPDMRLDLGYTEDDPPPEYDVTERVRQLNEELAKDPTPINERERSIKFKEKLIDFEAPAPDYGESDNGEEESEFANQAEGPELTNENIALSHPSPRSPSSSKESMEQSTTETKTEKSEKSSSLGDDEKILVERGGKFELVSSSDLSSEEKQFYGIEPLNGESEVSPHPPDKPRPSTANGNTPRSRSHSNPRAQSAGLPPINNIADFDFNYVSPYALSDRDKEILAKQKKQKEENEKKQRELRLRKDGAVKEDADDAFQAWLRKKRDQAAMRRKQDAEAKQREAEENRSNVSDLEEEMHDPEGAYSEWVKLKRQQKNKEKQIEQHKQREMEDGWSTRPRTQCNQAFKEWLKKKKQDQQNSQKEEKQKARVHRLLAHRCRKSMALTRAIKVSQSFRYVDYYGYR